MGAGAQVHNQKPKWINLPPVVDNSGACVESPVWATQVDWEQSL